MAIADGAEILIRDIERIPEMRGAELLQKEVWGMADLEVTPLNQMVAAKAAGGILIGAFDGPVLVGFAYGFPGYEDGQPMIHSHMLAVKPEYRNLDLGYKLKLAQREQALARGITRMTWTFDPLQSLNAHFNLGEQSPEMARAWRGATRRVFTEAIASGYLVEDFFRRTQGEQRLGVYVLSRGRKIEDFVR